MSPKGSEAKQRPNKEEQPKEVHIEYQKEKYYRVRFQAKSHPNDTDDVMLAVNGETLLIGREKEVVVPQRFLECADHAVHQHFRQLPNKPRKVMGTIKTYPYDRLGEATEMEYFKQKDEGTALTRDAIRKHGFGLEPEDN
jgi:hypothetical protein